LGSESVVLDKTNQRWSPRGEHNKGGDIEPLSSTHESSKKKRSREIGVGGKAEPGGKREGQTLSQRVIKKKQDRCLHINLLEVPPRAGRKNP